MKKSFFFFVFKNNRGHLCVSQLRKTVHAGIAAQASSQELGLDCLWISILLVCDLGQVPHLSLPWLIHLIKKMFIVKVLYGVTLRIKLHGMCLHVKPLTGLYSSAFCNCDQMPKTKLLMNQSGLFNSHTVSKIQVQD